MQLECEGGNIHRNLRSGFFEIPKLMEIIADKMFQLQRMCPSGGYKLNRIQLPKRSPFDRPSDCREWSGSIISCGRIPGRDNPDVDNIVLGESAAEGPSARPDGRLTRLRFVPPGLFPNNGIPRSVQTEDDYPSFSSELLYRLAHSSSSVQSFSHGELFLLLFFRAMEDVVGLRDICCSTRCRS